MIGKLIHKYQYVHLGLGLLGNSLFVAGSVLFFEKFSSWHHVAVWLFVIGSTGMWIGAVGKAIVEFERARDSRH